MDDSDNDNVSDVDPLNEIEKILKRYNHTIETILEHKDFKERNLIL